MINTASDVLKQQSELESQSGSYRKSMWEATESMRVFFFFFTASLTKLKNRKDEEAFMRARNHDYNFFGIKT